MKTINIWYNPARSQAKKASGFNLTSVFAWVSVLLIIVLFWSGISVVYKNNYVPHAIAKIEHKERKFLATHKTIQKKISGIRSFV